MYYIQIATPRIKNEKFTFVPSDHFIFSIIAGDGITENHRLLVIVLEVLEVLEV